MNRSNQAPDRPAPQAVHDQFNRGEISAEIVRDVLNYDRETGIFTWKKPTARRMKVGDLAGSICKKRKNLRVRILGKAYLANRLAFVYVNGAWPIFEIDHIDTDSLNNSYDNLREATPSQNCANKKNRKDNKTGVKGVYYNNKKKKYIASVRVNGKLITGGGFSEIGPAAESYRNLALKYFGEFARFE